MPAPIYERHKRRLTQRDVDRAIAIAESGKLAGRILEWTDEKTPGLALRISKTSAVWYARLRNKTIRIATAYEMGLASAQFCATHLRFAAKRKRNLKVLLELLLREERRHGWIHYDPTSEELPRIRRTGSVGLLQRIADDASPWGIERLQRSVWTWQELTDEFLAHKEQKIRKTYFKNYTRILRLKEFDPLKNKRVPDITIRDLEAVRDEIFKRWAPSTVKRAVQQGKEMMSWAWRYHASKSGLHDTQYQWWERWSIEYKTGRRTHEPLIEELARTLVIAENFRSLSEKEHETFPGTLGALWGVVLTAQRTGSLVQTRLSRLFEHKDHKGWKVASWTREEMKGGPDGGRSHSLPLPPAALGILLRYHNIADKKSDWLFPSGKSDGHVTKSALNQILYRLQGKRYDLKSRAKPPRKGKPGPKPSVTRRRRQDLLGQYGIRPWNPHDVRRTLTSFLDNLELGGAASAILAHKIPTQKVPERELMAPVTQQHYNSSQKISLKKRGLELWVKAILTAYKQEKVKLARTSPKSIDVGLRKTANQRITRPLPTSMISQ